jgi:hypothetical protein
MRAAFKVSRGESLLPLLRELLGECLLFSGDLSYLASLLLGEVSF